MSIKQYKPGMPIEAGQWVTLTSFMRGAICGRPGLVVGKKAKTFEVSELHSGYGNREDELDPPVIKRQTQISFVCDTREEAIAVHNAAIEDFDLQFKLDRARMKEDSERRASAISKLVNGEAT